MTDIQIVRQQQISFGASGQSALSDEIFIKILESFQDRLMQLKNARLHVFMALACQESKIVRGAGKPLSLRALEKIVPYSRPVIAPALDYLCEYRFLVELDERGPEGEKQYRVCSYAWFGTKLGAPAFHPGDVADVPANPNGVPQIKAPPGGKDSLPPKPKPTVSRGKDSESTTRDGERKSFQACKESLHADASFVVVDELDSNLIENNSTTTNTSTVPCNRTAERAGAIAKSLERDFGILYPTCNTLANLKHVDDDYLDLLFDFKQKDSNARGRLPGWWVMRIRENWKPPKAKAAHWWGEEFDEFVVR